MITSFAMAAMTSSGTKPMVYPCLAANRPARGFICSRGLAAASHLGFRAASLQAAARHDKFGAAAGRPPFWVWSRENLADAPPRFML
jgi:hypothetical protein